jgi:hypothetical protein
MRLRTTLSAALASALLVATPVLAQPASAVTPPPTGCPATMWPGRTMTCNGWIYWGAQHGTARVHTTAYIDMPRMPAGSAVWIRWTLNGTYVSGHHYYAFPWSSLGKLCSVRVYVKVPHGETYSKTYNYGRVVAPA